MELVVERQRPGGVRLADHRIERDLVERQIGGFSGGRGPHARQRRIDFQNPAQIVGQVRCSVGQGDQSVGAADDADAVFALVAIRHNFHGNPPLVSTAFRPHVAVHDTKARGQGRRQIGDAHRGCVETSPGFLYRLIATTLPKPWEGPP